MALVKCYECGTEISDQAKACPQCGASQSRAAKKKAERAAFAASPAGKRQRKIILYLYALMAVIGIALWNIKSGSAPEATTAVSGAPSKPKEISSMDALFMCQQAFKMIAKDPEKAKIPYVDDHGGGSESYFAWGASTKMMRMRNGLGLEVAASGSCTVDRSTRKITSLTLDGKSIL